MPFLQTDEETPAIIPPPTTAFAPDRSHRTVITPPDSDPSEFPEHSGRNRPSVVSPGPSVIEVPTQAIATSLPTLPIEETPSPAAVSSSAHRSQIGTAALAGILVALGVVFVGALFAVVWIKRKRDRQRGRGMRGGGIVEEKPPSYEAAVYGPDSDGNRWVRGIDSQSRFPQRRIPLTCISPQSQHLDSPEAPILQSPPPTHQGIVAPRPISTNNIISLRRLDTITTSFPAEPQPQPQQPSQPEIIVFPHDSPVLAPENDDALSLRAALRMSQTNSRVVSSQSRASGRFTENFDDDDNNDAASVVSDLREDERIVAAEIV